MHDDTSEDLKRSITATLTYIMGLASVAELYGLQAYLSSLASQMAPVQAPRFDTIGQMPAALGQQMTEIERQQIAQAQFKPARYRQEVAERQRQSMLQAQGPNITSDPVQYRQEG